MAGSDVGYYTLPVILSFDGIEKSVNSKLGKAFGDVGKRSSKALADGTEADLKRATDAYQKLRNKAEDALGKVRVEEEKLKKARAGGKTEQIAAAEERYNKALRDSSTATRAAKDSYNDLSNAQKRLGDGTRGLGGSFGDLGSMAGKAGVALTAAGVVAAGAALAGIAALGAGVIVAGRELYDLGRAWDDVTDSIAVRTGRLGPELEKLTDAVKGIAPSTASSIAQLGEVVGSVSQSLRVSGMDLAEVSKTVADLNRLTGESLNVRELGKAFRGFGIDAKQQVPTLDALYRASAATGMSVNDLVASVVTAGPAARTMGLDLSQTAALLASFEDAGLDGSKALGALSLAAKNLAKDGIAPAAGLRDTLTQIKGLIDAGDDPRAINLATKIFGRGYAPILDAIRSGALDAQSLNDALADGGVTIEQVAQSTADWSERWQQLKNTLSVALEPLASGVFEMINAKLDGLADWVTQNQSKVIGFFQQLADYSFRAAIAIVQFTADSLRGLGEMIKGFSEGLADLGGVLKYIPGFGKLGEALEKIDDATAGVPAQLNKAADALERSVIPGLNKARSYTDAYIERTKQATRFTEVLGNSIVTINDNGDIVLNDNTPEVEQKLADLGVTVTKMPDGTVKVGADTQEAKDILDAYRAQEQGEMISLPVDADTAKASAAIDELQKRILGGVDMPINTGGGDPFNPGGIFGDVQTPGGPRGFASSSRTGSDKGLNPNTVAAKRAVESAFPAIRNIGGFRQPDGYNEHFRGEAIDVMIPDWGSPAGKAYGDKVAKYLLANSSSLGVDYVLWQQRQWNADGTSSAMADRKSPTANHMDHVHAHTVNTPNLPGAQALKSSPAGGMRRFGPSGAPSSGGSIPGLDVSANPMIPATLSSGIDTSGLSNITQPGTPGVNEFSEAGFFTPDAKRIRDASQRIADANENIAAADAAVAQAEARKRELAFDADESSVLSADEGVRSAKARADKARREALDAQTDYSETLKGDFSKAKDSKSAAAGKQGGGLGEIGSIASSFLTETFGLPDLTQFMPLQMFNSVLGAFDWSTMGMSPEAQAAKAAAQGTSSGAFGIPDIAAPPMPTGGMHAGAGGAPGPSQIVNVDQSQNFNNSPLGWDPAKTEKERNNNINRAPRLPVGMGAQ